MCSTGCCPSLQSNRRIACGEALNQRIASWERMIPPRAASGERRHLLRVAISPGEVTQCEAVREAFTQVNKFGQYFLPTISQWTPRRNYAQATDSGMSSESSGCTHRKASACPLCVVGRALSVASTHRSAEQAQATPNKSQIV